MKVRAKFVVWMVFIAVLCLAPPGANTALAKGESNDLGKIAMVIHDEGTFVAYNQIRAGGILGSQGLFGAIAAAVIRKEQDASGKDKVMQDELRNALGTWSYTNTFRDALAENLEPELLKEKIEIIVIDKDRPYKKVEREFYKHGSSRYAKTLATFGNMPDGVYDYTPLVSRGIDTVLDLQLASLVQAKSSTSSKLIPVFGTWVRMLDLKDASAVGAKSVVQRAKGKAAQEFWFLLKNNGDYTKEHLAQMSQTTAAKLAKKINKMLK